MKFLGLRNGHDVNISYSDGQNVKHIKFERYFQKKHYDWYTDDYIISKNQYGQPVIVQNKDYVPDVVNLAIKLFNIDINELDAIAMSADTRYHKIGRELEPDELYYEVKDHNFWNQFKCPIFNINHHYSHALSIWPCQSYDNIKTHFIIDGEGDKHIHTSVISQDKVLHYIQKNYGSSDGCDKLGLSDCLEEIAKTLEIKGYNLDHAGKVMALKSFHNVPDNVLKDNLQKYNFLSYQDLDSFINQMFKQQSQSFLSIKQRFINLAYYAHEFCQIKMPEYMLKYADKNDIVGYTGGTCQNTVVNSYIQKAFPKCVMVPHCPDDGISLGCLEFLRRKYDQPEFDNTNFPFWQFDEAPPSLPSKQTIDKTAELLAQGKIVAWYQGNGELGPRALGNRSILMNPAIKNGKDIINNKVKHREPYRPFGASVLLEHTSKYFDCDYESPFMLHVVDIKSKDFFPAITHVDGTSRIQTVNHQPQYSIYRDLIQSFYDKTGIPMVLNTSLNNDGKPIAGYIDNAKELYEKSELDVLVVGDEIMMKK